MKRGRTLYNKVKKSRNVHDKSGTKGKKRRTMFFGPADLEGGGFPENQKSLIRKIKAFDSPQAVRNAYRKKYTSLGYTTGPGNVMLPPEGSNLPAVMIPKLSQITSLNRAKNGKGRRGMSPMDGGGVIL